MAGKEAVYFIVDVSPSMSVIDPHTHTRPIDTAKNAIQLYIQNKLLFNKCKDVIGIILCGTETHNDLSELDPTQYQHIDDLFGLSPMKLTLLNEVDNIQCSADDNNGGGGGSDDQSADIVDGIVVAMDSINRFCKKLKWVKRLFVFTNCCQPINDDIDGVQSIIEGLVQSQYRVNIVGFGFNDVVEFEDDDDGDDNTDGIKVKHEIDPDNPYSEINVPPDDNKSTLQLKNEQVLRYIAKHAHGAVFTPQSALALLSEFSKKSINQVSKLRGDLVFGAVSDDLENTALMRISVHTFAQTSESRFPTLKKVTADQFDRMQGDAADGVDDDDKPIGVLQERSYRKAGDDDDDDNNRKPSEVVDSQMLIKAYRYGKELIPITDDEINTLIKQPSYKGISLIGFAPKSAIPRHVLIGSVDCIVAEPGNELAEMAISSLAHALYETEKVMIVRYVKRVNDRPLLGVCTPFVSNEMECLHFNQIPYAQDMRDYTFQSLVSKAHFKPSTQQTKAARDLIKQLDLMTASVDESGNPSEALKPELTFNPVLQHFYQNVQRRALDPKAAIEPLTPVIAKYVQPDKQLQQRASNAINNFRAQFKLTRKDVGKNKKQKLADWRAQLNATANELSETDVESAKRARISGDTATYESILNKSITRVSIDQPVETFNVLISRSDESAELAVKQMIDIVHSLIVMTGDSGLDAAYQCLIALRTGCVTTHHGRQFNEMLYSLVKTYKNARAKSALINKISSEQHKIVPVTIEEDDACEYTVDTAETFYDQFHLQPTPSQGSTEFQDPSQRFDSLQ